MADDENSYEFYGKKKDTEIDLEKALDKFLEKARRLQKERAELIREIEELGEEMEKETEGLEREVSTLKEQAMSLKEVLSTMRHNK